jgi:hypothetical protein
MKNNPLGRKQATNNEKNRENAANPLWKRLVGGDWGAVECT